MTQKSKRLFFTDPIKALYMLVEFEVSFEEWDGFHLRWEIRDNNTNVYYIAKESESIFLPKEDDEGRLLGRLGACYFRYNGDQWVGHATTLIKEPTIIMRTGKHFLDAEVEGE